MGNWTEAQFIKAIREGKFKGLDGGLLMMIESTPVKEILHNDIIDFAPIGRFAFGRILLLGDAALATTPNMGQGVCQAIESSVILCKPFLKNEAVENALLEFEQRRLNRTAFIVNRSW